MSNIDDNKISYEIKNQCCNNFVELIEQFCQSLEVEKNFSKHTIRNYRNDLMSFVLWCDRNDIDPLLCNYRELRYYLGEMDSAQYSRTTINRRLSSLRSFYK